GAERFLADQLRIRRSNSGPSIRDRRWLDFESVREREILRFERHHRLMCSIGSRPGALRINRVLEVFADEFAGRLALRVRLFELKDALAAFCTSEFQILADTVI